MNSPAPTSRSDGDLTRRRILEAASEVFAKHGYLDASLSEIGELAGASAGLVHYHFGGKAALYEAVWRACVALAEESYPPDGGVAADAPPEERLRGHIRTFVRLMADNGRLGHLHRLNLHEIAQPTPFMAELLREMRQPHTTHLAAVLRELLGPEAGEEEVSLCEMSIVGQARMARAGRGTRSPDLTTPLDPERAEALAEHITEFSLAGIAAIRVRLEKGGRSRPRSRRVGKAGGARKAAAKAVLLPMLSAVSLLAVGCGGGDEGGGNAARPAPPTKANYATVGEHDFAEILEALGTVRANEAILLSATVTERVEEVFFEDGEPVEAGVLLVRLSDDEERAMLLAAELEVAEQEREIERISGLAADGAVSQVRLDETRTRRDIALQRVEEAKARLADRRIEAPFDGVLGFRQVSPGALVSPGDPIATLDALDPVWLDFPIPETFLRELGPGLEIEALAAAFPGEVFAGEVTQIDTRIDPATRAAMVRAAIPNPEGRLRPGMLMTTELRSSPRRSPAIPERALVSVQSSHYVFLVEVEGEDGDRAVARRVEVVPGQRSPGLVEIVEGLEPGQRIVSDGLVGLASGSELELLDEYRGPSEPFRP